MGCSGFDMALARIQKKPVKKAFLKRPAAFPFTISSRARYPKTTIYAATDSHPQGFASLDSAFEWAQTYLARVSDRFGEKWTCKRLQKWSWIFTSAFSGVGAPETARGL